MKAAAGVHGGIGVGCETWGSGSWKWINFDIYDVGIKCLNCVLFAAHHKQEQ